MIARAFAILSLFALVACGADGEPVQPDAAIGIGIGSDGVHAGGTIGVSRGPLRVGVSIF